MTVPTVNLTFGKGSPHEKSSFPGGLFIGGKFVASSSGKTFEVLNPATEEVIANISEADGKDIDLAVEAAQKAYDSSWGLKVSGQQRGRYLNQIADIVEKNAAELAAIESLDNGKAVAFAQAVDVADVVNNLRYYAGWADKNPGQTIDAGPEKFAYTRHEPLGVVGQIIPWNFPLMMLGWKIAPALATGNCIVLKTAEQTPLSALRFADLVKDVLPPGVLNIVSGFGPVAGAAIASHMKISKVAFTGSTLTGRAILKAAASSNLKKVTLELGGKSPNIIFDDADLDQAVRWSSFGLFFNHGQCCCAGSRIYVQESIYDKFLDKFLSHVKNLKVGDPFHQDTFQGPQVSQLQFDRIMGHIKSGKDEGAKVELGGDRHGDKGYFIQPTVFTNVKEDAKIMREEIFGPVAVVAKFKDEGDLLRMANDTAYGLAAAVFTQNVTRAIDISNRLQAGTVWVNCYNLLQCQIPFGGFKESGIGRELGSYALTNYTEVKAVHVNLSIQPPV